MEKINDQLDFKVEPDKWLFNIQNEQKQVERDNHARRCRGAGITRASNSRVDRKKKRKAQRRARAAT